VSLVQLRECVHGLIAKEACQGETTAISINDLSISRRQLSVGVENLTLGIKDTVIVVSFHNLRNGPG
jgi:hypothetical protein